MESTTLEWNGDVDLNDGKLQEQYRAYRQRLDFVNSIGLGARMRTPDDLQEASSHLKHDLDFIHTG